MKQIVNLHLKSEVKKYWKEFYSFINLYFLPGLVFDYWSMDSKQYVHLFYWVCLRTGLKIHQKNKLRHENFRSVSYSFEA
jgi:hypothetical protein